MSPSSRPSTLGLAVLGLLEVGPLHPYGLQRLIKLWGKDQVVNVGQRANLYRTIDRLEAAGLVAVRHTERDQQFPERTVYELTEAGRRVYAMAHRHAGHVPLRVPGVSRRAVVRDGARTRRDTASCSSNAPTCVRQRLTELEQEIDQYSDELPRVSLLETEYLRAITAAEIAWLTSVLDDLRSGSLTWSAEDFDPANFDIPDARVRVARRSRPPRIRPTDATVEHVAHNRRLTPGIWRVMTGGRSMVLKCLSPDRPLRSHPADAHWTSGAEERRRWNYWARGGWPSGIAS